MLPLSLMIGETYSWVKGRECSPGLLNNSPLQASLGELNQLTSSHALIQAEEKEREIYVVFISN